MDSADAASLVENYLIPKYWQEDETKLLSDVTGQSQTVYYVINLGFPFGNYWYRHPVESAAAPVLLIILGCDFLAL
ncbi:hypothetical protein PR048_011566 [Dryococelus australis]|uniref:Uncharacterized protein n=1 Tax=Dryococelus australis TaxID=614101 RepID=A0ABQ9HMJ1_9NEOP|nr:hypothetical protein PR048_011566 [Dryococelus australis]